MSNETETSQFQPRNHRVLRALAVAGMLIIAITVLIAGVLFSSYRDTIAREETNLHNLAAAFAEQVRYATRVIELVIDHNEQLVRMEARDRAAPAVLELPDVGTGMLAGIFVYAADGRLLARSRTGPKVPQAPPPDTEPGKQVRFDISDVDPATGHATIVVRRGLYDPAGQRTGTIVLLADSQYFQRIFASTNLGSGGSVTLLHRDGTMLVRGPTLPLAIGHSFLNTPLFQEYLPRAPRGAFVTISPVDGKRRVYGYSAVDNYPLVIITGRDKADTMHVWTEWLWAAACFWTLLSLTLLFLAWRIGREASRQAALIARLSASEAQLAHSSRYLNAIIDALATPLWVLDASRRIVLFNKAFRCFVGRGSDELAGRQEAEVLDSDAAPARGELYRQVMEGGGKAIESDMRNGAGDIRTVMQLSARLDDGADTPEIVNSLTDITERKQVELRLAYLADFDPLTGLPNQAQLRRVLQEAITVAIAQDERVAVLVVALERLQEVADLLGHEAGDDAIRQAAALLRTLVPPCLCVARVKNNEFSLVLPLPPGQRPVDELALELHHLLSEPVRVGNREFFLAPVVGISLYPQDATSVNELMRLADIAKHRARAEASEPIHFHAESTHTLLNERLTIEQHLRHALDRGELRLAYQPKINVASGANAGFEVLLRWRNPVLGEVSPVRFIPIAEQTGLINPIGAWVLRTACADAARWQREFGIAPKIAVNLSIRQFFQKDLIETIRAALDDTGVKATALELEITESIAMSRVDVVERLLGEIRTLGVELSIDDFGTGYSSLAYLKRFPVQRLKIDRAFVRDLGRDADSTAIVRSVVALGHGLNMRIVAEGVETNEQLTLLRELGCDEYQGYLFSRPVPPGEVPALLGRAPA